jgi:hypothetical protein
MKIETQCDPQQVDRKGERGAALLTVLLISILLLSAGMALVTTTSLSTTGAIDSTAEMQAYFSAEAGLEATINVLRGNVALHDMVPTTTMMNFRTAVLPLFSNKTTDTSGVARLSGWLTYSYQNASIANDWRVPLTASYSPLTGIAYKVVVTDPDDPGGTKILEPTYVPSRILVRCEGFGPKGAIKRLEMIVTSAGIDIKAPGAITAAGGPPINLDLGDSAVVNYTGNDMSLPPKPAISAVAVSPGNEAAAQAAINAMNNPTQVQPNTAGTITSTNGAAFLQSADAARAFLTMMKANATENSRLFSTKALAVAAGGLGTTTHPRFTFIDNYSSGVAVDLGSGHQGSGLLIVTGNLETNGNTDFEGLILVLGRGHITRSGGGAGVIRGSIIVANFDPNGAAGTGFGSPTFSISGGGSSTVGYDSQWIDKARDLLGVSIAGVREYH